MKKMAGNRVVQLCNRLQEHFLDDDKLQQAIKKYFSLIDYNITPEHAFEIVIADDRPLCD